MLWSATYSTSGRKWLRGKRLANSSRASQWVVASRPSSRPASPSTKAPRHSPTISAPRAWARRKASVNSTGIAPGRHDDDVRLLHHLQSVGHLDHDSLIAADSAGGNGAVANLVTRQVRRLPGCAQHHTGHGEMEQAHIVEGERGDTKRSHEVCPAVDIGLIVSKIGIRAAFAIISTTRECGLPSDQ